MRRALLLALGFMILLTAGVIWVTAYQVGYQVGFLEGRLQAEEVAPLKHPIDYGVSRLFYAKRLDNESVTGHTSEELGIVLIKSESEYFNGYYIYIISGQEEKALAWMTQPAQSFASPVVKHGDEFYEIGWAWVEYGFGQPILSGERLLTLMSLVIGWGIFAAFAYALSIPQPPQSQD